MRKVFLHGVLRDPAHPNPYELPVASAADALRILSHQVPTLRPDCNGPKRIKVVGVEDPKALFEVSEGDIHVVPQLNGGGRSGGFLQMLIGAALIALSFAVAPAVAPFMLSMGASLLLGGLMQVLSPQPKRKTTEGGVYLGAPQNTVKIGTTIPILCGRAVIGGQLLTSNVSAGALIKKITSSTTTVATAG